MKLQLNPSIAGTQAITAGAPAAKTPGPAATPGDGIGISNVLVALDQAPKISRIAAAVQAGSYQVPAAATANAIVEDALSALSERN